MKSIFLTLTIAIVSYCSYGQTNIPGTTPIGGPLSSSGSLLNFTTGGVTSIQENWGINLCGNSLRPVRIYNSSILVGYQGYSQDFGIGNAYISGSVGLGTLGYSGYKLAVAGPSMSANAGNLALTVPGLTQGEKSSISFYSTFETTPDNGPRRTSDIFAGYNGTAWGGEYLAFGVGNNGSANDGALPTSEKMRIAANGSVAIGTTDTKGYKLAVNGNVIATAVTVKLYADWPDYVFKPTYHLPSLTAVKAYIDKNEHLPDMPSAEDVSKNGINLGEMVKLQTKKIEELTLYLVEQNKQIAEQQKITQTQQEQINKLTQQLTIITKALNKN